MAPKKAWCPQIFGKILASFSIITIYKIKPPLLIFFEVCNRTAQKQFTTVLERLRRIIANQQTGPELARTNASIRFLQPVEIAQTDEWA